MQVERIHSTGKIFVPEKNDKLVKQIKKTETSTAIDSESGSHNHGNQERENAKKDEEGISTFPGKTSPTQKHKTSEGLNITV